MLLLVVADVVVASNLSNTEKGIFVCKREKCLNVHNQKSTSCDKFVGNRDNLMSVSVKIVGRFAFFL